MSADSASCCRAPLESRGARGLRGVVVGVGALSLAGGLVFEQRGLLAFGAVFLAEELYETAVLILVVRAGLRARGVAGG